MMVALIAFWFAAAVVVTWILLIAAWMAWVIAKGVIRFLNVIGIKCR